MHITSASSLDLPAVDPAYFCHHVDLDVHVKARRWVKDVVKKLSWVKSSMINETGSEEDDIKRDARTVFHPVRLTYL